MTVYDPFVPDATVKDPDIAPPATVHNGFEIKPPGDDAMVHAVSTSAKFEPAMRTFVPGRPDVGNKPTEGSTVNPAVALSISTPLKVPQITTVHPPTVAVVPFTVKYADTTPGAETTHEDAYVVLISAVVGRLVILHPVSFRLK